MKKFMPEVTDPKQLLQLLRDNCDGAEEKTYYRDLTPEELDQQREKLTENFVQLNQLEEDLNKIKEEFKGKMKPFREDLKVLVQNVRTRTTKVKGQLFHFANYEENIMETFDEEGIFVSSRRLEKEERQQKIFTIPKAANE